MDHNYIYILRNKTAARIDTGGSLVESMEFKSDYCWSLKVMGRVYDTFTG